MFLFTTRHTPGGLISPHLFILCLEILLVLIKNSSNIKRTESFEHCYLYTAYADDITFFLKDENSTVHPSEIFKLFSEFLRLKPNATKCKISEINVLKWVKAALCGMWCINLRNEAIKILGMFLFHALFKKGNS